MKNYQIEGKDGKMYWVHRSIAIIAVVFREDLDNHWSILANKRGKGTPDFQGLWNCPCGYLDFDETLKEACSREVEEECGLKIESAEFELVGINDSVKANLQNVSIRYFTVLRDNLNNTEISIGTTGEPDEVEEVKWIPVDDIDQYEWAFGHGDILKDLI